MPKIEYRLTDGTVLIHTMGTIPLPDQVAFEKHFQRKFGVIQIIDRRLAEYHVAVAAATAAGQEPPEVEEAALPPAEWRAFFSWCWLRRHEPEKTPSPFEAFLEAVVEDMYIEDEEAQEEPPSGEDEVDPVDAELIESGSGLDPTGRDQPLTTQPG